MNGYKLDGTDNERIRQFLYNEDNAHKCDKCPYAGAYGEKTNGRLQCGQYRCWVTVHCEN